MCFTAVTKNWDKMWTWKRYENAQLKTLNPIYVWMAWVNDIDKP